MRCYAEPPNAEDNRARTRDQPGTDKQAVRAQVDPFGGENQASRAVAGGQCRGRRYRKMTFGRGRWQCPRVAVATRQGARSGRTPNAQRQPARAIEPTVTEQARCARS
jgi:hypothetical protein